MNWFFQLLSNATVLVILILIAWGAVKLWLKSDKQWGIFRRRGADFEIYKLYKKICFGASFLAIYNVITYIYLISNSSLIFKIDGAVAVIGMIILVVMAKKTRRALAERGRNTDWLEIQLNLAVPSFLAFEFWLKHKAPDWLLAGFFKLFPVAI